MKRHILFLIIILLSWAGYSQSLSVASFNELPNDLDARANYPKADQQTGKKCAIIKVVTTQQGFNFDIGQLAINDIVSHPELNEIWLYVPAGAKKLKINHTQLGFLKTESNDGYYWFPIAIKSATCYRLELVSGTVNVIVESPKQQTGWLILKSDPSEADVYLKVNGVESLEGKTPFQKKLAYGTYDFRLKKKLYHDEVGVATINSGKVELNASLTPAHGRISITSNPSGASVDIDGIRDTYTTPCTTDVLPSGAYRVTLSKAKYATASKMVTVTDGAVVPLKVDLSANFSHITISSLQGADIYLNGNKVGSTSYADDLTPGLYEFEARLASHRTDKRQIEVEANRPQSITLNPKPIYGSLDVMSTPMGASITVDGKRHGETPNTIDQLLEGEHTVTISMNGYSSETRKVTIRENQTAEVSATLRNTVSVAISCTPESASLYLDGQYLGKGSGRYDISLGNHTLKAEADKYEAWQQAIAVTSSTSSVNVQMEPVLANQSFTVNGATFTMVAVQGGTFTMGATSEQGSDVEKDEKPTHQVTLSSYLIGQTEVTQALWQAVMGSNPSYFKGGNLPVEQVSWNDCQEFISRLNQKTGKHFRLPTEAEWEYAARGGKQSRGYKYAGSNTIGDVAWYDGNSGSKTHPVKTKQANELGIYDMSGNVWEWCSDWYGSYSSSAQTNPTGASSGSNRVRRGGSWNYGAGGCRSSYRYYYSPGSRYNGIGLRLCLSE